jgi:hypothetical protein
LKDGRCHQRPNKKINIYLQQHYATVFLKKKTGDGYVFLSLAPLSICFVMYSLLRPSVQLKGWGFFFTVKNKRLRHFLSMGRQWEGTSGPSPSAQLSYRLCSGDWTMHCTYTGEGGRLSSSIGQSVNPLARRPQPLLRLLPHPIPRPQRWQPEHIGFGARETEVAATVGGGPGGTCGGVSRAFSSRAGDRMHQRANGGAGPREGTPVARLGTAQVRTPHPLLVPPRYL